MSDSIPQIIITPGEPAGIGPDITLQIASLDWPAEMIVVCDPELLLTRAKQLTIPITLLPYNVSPPTPHQKNHLKIIPIKLAAPCEPGKLNTANASYVIQCLETAAEFCQKNNSALVTGPIQKNILNEAGISFSGHTEFLANYFHAKKSVMLFIVDHLKVALATTHIPLKNVAQMLSIESLVETISILHHDLKKYFSISNPKILICGLNPHAGEMGHLGREEIDILTPAIKHCQEKSMNVQGPVPADTAFIPESIKNVDAIVAMYHDQALPLIKHIAFDRAVNMTLGLPIVRTSVDHGTALSLAGTGKANSKSLEAAIQLAISLNRPK